MTSHNVVAVYPSILHCLEAAAGTERSILAVTSPKLKRTGSTWMGFPSTLLLQLLFDCKINDRIRTEGSWFDVKLEVVFFFPCLPLDSGPPRFTLCLRACLQEPRNAVLPVCANPALQHSPSHSTTVFSQRVIVRSHMHTMCMRASQSTPTLAPPTRSHVHIHTHTPCLLECNHGNGAPAAQQGRWWRQQKRGGRVPRFIHELMNQSVALMTEPTLFNVNILS